jgi:O-antigen/teichoic acid export membrane protein
LAAAVIVARVLGAQRAGQFLYLLWVADFTAIVTTFALPLAATRFLADLSAQHRFADAEAVGGWLYRRYVGLALIGAAATFTIASRVTAGAIDARLVSACLGGYFFTTVLQTYYLAHLAGYQEFRVSTRIAIMSAMALVVGVSVGTPAWGVAGATIGYLAGSMPGAVSSVRCLRWSRPGPPIPVELRSRLVNYALYTWITAIVAAITSSRTEVFFIERYAGDFWVTMFAIGISLSTLASQGPMLLTGPLVPHFAQLAGAGRLDALRARYAGAIRVLALMLFPLCLGLSSLIPVLLPFVYGRDFVAAVPSAMVLVACAALAFGTVSAAALQALERVSYVALVGAIGAIAVGAAGLLVVPRWGIWGAAWSHIVIQAAMAAAGAIYLSTRHGFPFPIRHLVKMFVAALACALASGAIVWTSGSIASIFIAIPVSAAVYVVMVRSLRAIDARDLLLLDGLVGRLPASMRPRLVGLIDYLTGSRSRPWQSPDPDHLPSLP